jgi:pimeloyl-ACP methyl ester carboxylesterase
VLGATASGVLAILLVTARTVAAQGMPPPAPPATQGDFAGLVDIGGRRLYLECQGTGSPTVVLVAGYQNRADIWSVDLHEPAGRRLMVLPGVAGFTRVCAYDRPGTTGAVNPDLSAIAEGDPSLRSRSDPVAVPRTAQDLVAELHTLLPAAGGPGPYVLAGHSLGGVIVRLYASAYPDEVVGLVLVDAPHEELNAQIQVLLTPAQWAEFEQLSQSPPPDWAGYAALERVDLDASFAQLGQARVDAPLRPLPLAVLARGRPGDVPLPDGVGEVFEQLALADQQELATLVPHARLSIARQSQHFIQQDQPAIVTEAIRRMVAGVRAPDTWYDLAACCAP